MTKMKSYLLRKFMIFAHKYNWHYAPPFYCEGRKMYWCQYCGLKHFQADYVETLQYISDKMKNRQTIYDTIFNHGVDYTNKNLESYVKIGSFKK